MEEIAGPGQNPTTPHPMPKRIDPKIRLISIFFEEGKIIFFVKIKFCLFLKKNRRGEVIKIAPPITKARDGSHIPNMSKKLITLAGLVILEIVKPVPKITPLMKTNIF